LEQIQNSSFWFGQTPTRIPTYISLAKGKSFRKQLNEGQSATTNDLTYILECDLLFPSHSRSRMLRREFVRAGLAFGAVNIVSGSHKFAQGQSADRLLSVASPDLYASVTRFGSAVLASSLPTKLEAFLARHTVSSLDKSESPHFHERFDQPFQFNVGNEHFIGQTTLDNRNVLVNDFPHLLETGMAASDFTRLNGPEMDELSNKDNELLWKPRCGCPPIRLPVSAKLRRRPTESEFDQFDKWSRSNGSLELQYVRDFCLCNKPTLLGFGYVDTRAASRGQFAITHTSWA
jgi:hypothetical protein